MHDLATVLGRHHQRLGRHLPFGAPVLRFRQGHDVVRGVPQCHQRPALRQRDRVVERAIPGHYLRRLSSADSTWTKSTHAGDLPGDDRQMQREPVLNVGRKGTSVGGKRIKDSVSHLAEHHAHKQTVVILGVDDQIDACMDGLRSIASGPDHEDRQRGGSIAVAMMLGILSVLNKSLQGLSTGRWPFFLLNSKFLRMKEGHRSCADKF
jgi:hypothetical protein